MVNLICIINNNYGLILIKYLTRMRKLYEYILHQFMWYIGLKYGSLNKK